MNHSLESLQLDSFRTPPVIWGQKDHSYRGAQLTSGLSRGKAEVGEHTRSSSEVPRKLHLLIWGFLFYFIIIFLK